MKMGLASKAAPATPLMMRRPPAAASHHAPSMGPVATVGAEEEGCVAFDVGAGVVPQDASSKMTSEVPSGCAILCILCRINSNSVCREFSSENRRKKIP